MSEGYKPEDMKVVITLPDGTKHVCSGWVEKSSIYSEKSFHTTLDGECGKDSENNI